MSLLLRYIPLGLLVILLLVLLVKRTYKSTPYFLAYVIFGVAAGIARLITRLAVPNGPFTYSTVYWITEAGYDLLGILAMYEVVTTTTGGLLRGRRARAVFAALVLIGLCLSIARSYAIPSQLGHGPLSYVVIGEVAVRFVQVLVFAGLVTLVPVLGLRWRQYPFGVATGFGLNATISLLINLKYSDFGTRFKLLWAITQIVAYSVAVLIWIWFFSVPQKIETPAPELSAPSPGDLKQYKDALRRMR
jgi:hypothetical protein